MNNWWLMEMKGGGRFALQSDVRPDTTQDIKSPAPEGCIGLTIAANSYKVISGMYSDEQIAFLLNPPRQTGFVTVDPQVGMLVRTPNGVGEIEALGDDYIVVDGVSWKPYEVVCLSIVM